MGDKLKKKYFILTGLFICICALLLIGLFYITGGEMETIDLKVLNSNDLSKAHIESFKNKRILFGHQSVGANIIKGLNEISDTFKIVDLEGKPTSEEPALIHFRVGKNGSPTSKIDHFLKIVMQNNKTEIAILKLCYADINNDTNIYEVFNYYKNEMIKLQNNSPNIKIIHSTIPLFRNSGGIKAKIKHLFKFDKNINRNKFNAMMRKEYNKDILFDLALFQSTYPDGVRNKAGNKNYSLINEYTDDGGHLNKKGRDVIASNFIDFISKL